MALVKIKNTVEAEHLRRVSCGEPKERIKRLRNTSARAVLGVRRLPSGDYTLQTSTVAAKNELDRSTEWLARTVSGSRRRYPDESTPCWFTESGPSPSTRSNSNRRSMPSPKQNHTLHPGLGIVKAAWPQAAQGKDYSSPVVDTYEPAAANRMLDEGIVKGADCQDMRESTTATYDCGNVTSASDTAM